MQPIPADARRFLAGFAFGLSERVRGFSHACLVGMPLTGFIVAVTLAHVPATLDALNYFDPPKRLLWSVLALCLAIASLRSERSGHKGLRAGLAAYLLWIAVRTLLRDRPSVETDVLMTWLLPGLLLGLGLAMNRERTIKPLAWGLLLAAAIQSLLMVLQYLGRDPFFASTTTAFAYRPERMIGTIGYQNQAADFLALASIAFIILVRPRSVRLLAFCAVLVVIGLTGNRAALVAFVFSVLAVEALGVISAASNKKQVVLSSAALMAVLLVGIIGLLVFAPVTRGRFAEIATNPRQVPAFSSRVVMAQAAAAMWTEKPVVGWGAGEFAFQYLDRLREMLPAEKTHDVLKDLVFARETHNDYLQFGAEFGLVGIAILSCLLFLIYRVSWKSRTMEPVPSACCIYVLVYMLLSSLVSFPWQASVAGPLAALLLGMMLPRERTTPAALPGPVRIPVRALECSAYLFLSGLIVVWQTTEAYLNVRIPGQLRAGAGANLARTVPKWMHKHHAIIGAAFARDGAYDDALSELTLAYGGYRDTLLYNNLGHVLSKQGKWVEAVQVYREWAETGIDHANALQNLSIACQETGDFEDAALALESKMRLWNEHDIESVQRVAMLYLRAGNARAAFHLLRQYESDHVTAYEDLPAEYNSLAGAILVGLGKHRQARKRLKAALRKNPDMPGARKNLDALEAAKR